MSVVKKNVIQKAKRRVTALTGAARPGRRLTAVAAVGFSLLGMNAAQAQTNGFQVPVTGGTILAALGFQGGQQPSSVGTATASFIDFTGSSFNAIYNPYMAVVQGVQGTFGVSYAAGQVFGQATTVNHNVAGMLSFGNLGGSLRFSNDDQRALNGFGTADAYGSLTLGAFGPNGGGRPFGYGVWPLASYWTAGGTYDYSSYVAANVDGVQTNGTVTGGTFLRVTGNDTLNSGWVQPPAFRPTTRNNRLLSEAILTDTVSLQQEIRLYRNTAQLRWVVVNRDTVSHRVFLKFVVNTRSAVSLSLTATGGVNVTDNAYFYSDPSVGPTLRSQVYGVNPDGTVPLAVPDQMDIYGARYQPDSLTNEPFHARFNFTGRGATKPSTVFFGDSEDLFPLATFQHSGLFSPPLASVRYSPLEDGAAVAVYFPAVNVGPGASSAPIVTYYGNGSSTDNFDDDFSVATEAEEAFQYNSGAINTLTTAQKSNPTLTDTARAFLSPSQLTIFGSVYNLLLSEAQFNVVLPDVRMTVTLPDGLQFGTNPSTGQLDTPTKAVGNITGDRDSIQSWVAQPTGTVFGTVSYQFTASVGGISPLSRSVSRPVTIPATPLYNVSADYYQMIGFPFDFDAAATNNGDTASIINGLTQPRDDNPGSKVFYRWVPDPDSIDGTGKYVASTTLQRGVGYYYRPALSRLLFLNGARPDPNSTPVSPSQQVTYFQQVLERGWNMISNPWVYSVPVSYISLGTVDANNPDQNLGLTTFTDAVRSGLVRGGIFFYNPNKRDYDFFQDFSQELKPFQAYWVYLDDRRVMRIAVPSTRQSAVLPATDGTIPPTRKKEVQGALASGRAFPTNPTTSNWKLQLLAKRVGANSSTDSQDSATLLGVSPDAKDGDDSRDLPKPPAIPQDYVSVRVLHEVTSGKIGRFAQDLKAPGGKKSWDLEVASDKDGPVTLAWPNLGQIPKGVKLALTDKQTGRVTSLRGSSSITLNVTAGTPSRFTITADKQASQPVQILNLKMTNAGRAQNGGTNYNLTFKVTADATIDARILTLSGKTVGVLASGRAVSNNSEVRLFWNGRSVDNTELPAGPYTLEVNARTESGDATPAKRPFLMLR